MPEHESDTTNQLTALLGLRFQCLVCGHRHHPESWTVGRCQWALVTRAVPNVPVLLLARADQRFNQARRTLVRRGVWRDAYTRAWGLVRCLIAPPATIVELAALDGAARYHGRYITWQRQHRVELTKFTRAVESLVAKVERLAARTPRRSKRTA